MEIDQGRDAWPAVAVDEKPLARFDGTERTGLRVSGAVGKHGQDIKALSREGLHQCFFQAAVGVGEGVAGKKQADGCGVSSRMHLPIGRHRIIDLRGRRVEDPLPGQGLRSVHSDGRITAVHSGPGGSVEVYLPSGMEAEVAAGRASAVADGVVTLDMAPGETAWLRIRSR